MGLTVVRYWSMTESMLRPRFLTSRRIRRHRRTSASASTKMRMFISSQSVLLTKIMMPSTTMTRRGSMCRTSSARLWMV